MYQRLYPDGGGFVVLLTSILLTHRIYVTVCAMQDFCRVERSPVRHTLLFMSFGTNSRILLFVTSPLLSTLSAWWCKGKQSLSAEGVAVGACAARGVDTSPLLSTLSAWWCKGKQSLPAEGVAVGACAARGVDTPLARGSQTCRNSLSRPADTE